MLSHLFPKHPQRRRIKIGAIAKDEAPYLIDWVFHHFYFGFDEIEIRVNNTTDNTLEVLQALHEVYGDKLQYRVDDDTYAKCQKRGKSFQKTAYQHMLNRARGDFSHLLFIDIDEYWTPADLCTGIHGFVTSFGRPDDVGAIAFRWFYDAPDAETRAFDALYQPQVALYRDAHVKTLYSLMHRPHRVTCHSGHLRSGHHFLASGARFDDTSSDLQTTYRSRVSAAQMAVFGDNVDRAFLIHRAHRSETEYLASLLRNRPYRGRTHEDIPLKANRTGFVQTAENIVTFTPPADALADYQQARAQLLARLPAGLLTKAKQSAMERAARLMQMLAEDPDLLRDYAFLFEGVQREQIRSQVAAVQRERVYGQVDEVTHDGTRLHVRGWFYRRGISVSETDIRLGQQPATGVTREARPDVRHAHASAPLECGVQLQFDWPANAGMMPALNVAGTPFALPDNPAGEAPLKQAAGQ